MVIVAVGIFAAFFLVATAQFQTYTIVLEEGAASVALLLLLGAVQDVPVLVFEALLVQFLIVGVESLAEQVITIFCEPFHLAVFLGLAFVFLVQALAIRKNFLDDASQRVVQNILVA